MQGRRDVEKTRKSRLYTSVIIVLIICLYTGLHLGVVYEAQEPSNFFGALLGFTDHLVEHPFQLFPSNFLMVGMVLCIGIFIDLYLYNEYLKVAGTVEDAHGDAAFETNIKQYDLEFVMNPKQIAMKRNQKVTNKMAPYNEEHKRVLRRYPSKEETVFCRQNSKILAEDLYLNQDGKWSQRNNNLIIFGASGAKKTRGMVLPNILQLLGCMIIVDPSGDIRKNVEPFLRQQGYIIKVFNLCDMTVSCRFNPFVDIRSPKDILKQVNVLLENTMYPSKGSGTYGDGAFWKMSMEALLCAVISYMHEVLPVEQRNYENMLEILRMHDLDENCDETIVTDFDQMFLNLGEANPASYGYHQYLTFKKAPAKTALNILISAAVLVSQYADMPEFNNLTYKDEMELHLIGEVKCAYFLQLPLANRTYSWFAATFFSDLLDTLYEKGQERMNREGLTSPELAIPVEIWMDEARNIGKIPNLGEYLATCRKYQIGMNLIFQNYSQIVEVYGKEEANSIMGNCDTMVFLGGSDSDTLKIVCEKLGKETVRNLSYGISKGRSSSTSTNKQQVGRELMSRIQVEQMSNNDCLVFVRSLRPFKRSKYELSNHPNYKYLVEADEANAIPEHFQLHFDEEEMEAVRVKSVNEEGYIYPPIVDSPRRRAQERAKERKAAAEEKAKAQSRREASGYQICDETRSAQAYKRNVKAKDAFTGEDATEHLAKLNIEDLQLVDDFDPLYEF